MNKQSVKPSNLAPIEYDSPNEQRCELVGGSLIFDY